MKKIDILRSMSMRQADPVGTFSPNRAQEACFKSLATFRAINGTNQGGKTTQQVVEVVHSLRGTHPYRHNYSRQRGGIIVNSRNQAALVFGRYFLEESLLPGPGIRNPFFRPDEVEVSWDKTVKPHCPKIIHHKETGSEVHFILSGAGNVEKRQRGTQYDWFCVDEDAADQELYDELLLRLSVAISDPDRPNGGWILWGVTEVSVNLAMEAYMDRCRDPSNTTHQMFTLLPEDSRAVSQEARDILNTSLSDKGRRIRNQGTASAKDFVTIYPSLRQRDRYIVPHAVDPDENYWISYDPGVDHPTGLLIAGQSKKDIKRLHALRFICQSRMTIAYEIDLIREWLNGRKLRGMIIDPCGGNRTEKGMGKSVRQQIMERMWEPHWWQDGKPFFPHVNPKHAAGIMAVREYLDPLDKSDPLFLVDTPTADNGLDVFYQQMCNYRGRESVHFTGPDGVIKKADEAPDCARYLIQASPTWENLGLNVEGQVRVPAAATVEEETVDQRRRRLSDAIYVRRKKSKRSIFS